MAWNHKSRIVAIGIVAQVAAGAFIAPGAADIIAASNVTNQNNDITAEDPTLTGTGWEAENILIGEEGQIGFTMPLRGPGGNAPPAAGAWVPGRVLKSAGWSEVITAAPIAAAIAAGSTATEIVLQAGQSAVDGFYVGMPISSASIGAGFKQYSIITHYDGDTRTAKIGETLGAAANGNFEIPANLLYLEGALSTEGPLLSVRVWRDRQVYDYVDVRVESLNFDMPVGNVNNTVFPSIEAAGKGTVHNVDQGVTPQIDPALLSIELAPCKGGKFSLDRVALGHNSLRYGNALTVAAPSNIHQESGQDAYETVSGTRTIDLDLNQMDTNTFNHRSRRGTQAIIPIMQTWGRGPGNNFGFVLPNTRLRGLNPGDNNGFVNLTGSAVQTTVDKSAAFAIWW